LPASASADAEDLDVRVVPTFRTVRVGDTLSIEIVISGVKVRSHSKDAGPGDRPKFRHRFSFRPQSVGTVKLGPYEVELDGRRMVSDEVQVKVLPEWTGGEGFDFRLSKDTAKVGERVELVVWQWFMSGRAARVSIRGDESFSVEFGRGTVFNRNEEGVPQPKTIPADRVYGYQVEIATETGGSSGGVYDEARRAFMPWRPEAGSKASKAFKDKKWNKYRIECRGNSIKTTVNGVVCADFRDSLNDRGIIGLQVHDVGDDSTPYEVRWRNIRIISLGE